MAKRAREEGFTLIELMIVVAIIAIIAAIAVPNLLSAKLAANESNAIATLRNITSAQAQFQQMSALDEDNDGTGEFGSFGDLSGAYFLDNRSGGGANPPLNPPVLSVSFQDVDPASGIVSKSGYNFVMYMPDAAGDGQIENGTTTPNVDPDNAELVWCCYAWPADYNSTGNRAFFVNQQGEILFTNQSVAQPYQGKNTIPATDAAFAPVGSVPGATIGMMGVISPGNPANDGETWVTLN